MSFSSVSPLYKLHRIEVVLTGCAKVENGGDVRVTDAGSGSCFTQKAKASRFIAEISLTDDFQCHETTQIDIERLVGNAHSAPTQLDRFPIFASH